MIRFNPLIFGGFDISGTTPPPSGAVEWKSPVATEAALPLAGNSDGDARVALDTDKIYVWDATTSKWIDSKLTTAAFGSTPNADGITVSSVTVGDITRSTINLEPADSTNPGAVSTGAQSFAGDKTFDDLVTASSGVETDSIDSITAGAGTLSIGTANASTINIGDAGVNVNLYGNTFYQDVTNLEVTDKQITLNKDGAAASAFNSGIELEEAGSITGYVSTSGDRNSWELKAPNQAGVATISPGAAGITIDQSSHDPVTLAAVGSAPNGDGATLTGQVLNLEPADSTNPGVVSTGTQNFAGDKTFDDDVAVVGSIDAQTGIDATTGTLKLGLANTTTVYLGDYDGGNTANIEIAAAINGNTYSIDNVGVLSNVGVFSTSPSTFDGVTATIGTNPISPSSDQAYISFTETNPFDSQITYISGGHLGINAITDVTVDSPTVNLGQIGGTTTAYGDVVLDSPNVDIGQVGGTTDIIGTVTIEYNPADSNDWAPPPTHVIEAIDQLADRFVEQDQVTKEPTGFPNRDDSLISFNDGTHTFSISPAIIGGSYDFYVKGQKFTKTGTESIAIPTPSSGGNYYFYFDSTGTLTVSAVNTFNPTTILQESAFVASVYWNSDTNTHTYFAEERHGLTMDGVTHAYLHTVFGARYLSGLALNFSSIPTIVDGTGNLPQNAQFPSDSGSLRDEDILHTLSSQSTIPVLYRQGQLWRKKAADSYPLVYTPGSRVPYNQFTGGSWTLTQVQDGKYVLVHYFGTNDANPGNAFVGIQGINEYGSIEAARTGANTEISSLAGLPFAEFVPVGSVIFQTRSTYTNAPKARIVSTDTGANYVDFRGTQLYTPAGTATTHGLLSGLSNDDHFQYLLGDGTRAMSGALDMGTHQINNIVDGTASTDAATVGQLTTATTGTANYFAGYDNTGVLSEVPGWIFYDDGSLEIGAQNSITIPPAIDNYISIAISPTVAPTSTDLVSLTGVQLNSPINDNITSYNGFQAFGYGTAAPTNFTGYLSQPGYTGNPTSITHFSASGSADATGGVVGVSITASSDANSIKGLDFSVSGNAVDITGVQVTPTGTYTDATGVKIDLSGANITNRPVGVDVTGGILTSTVQFTTQTALPQLVDSGNVIRPIFEVESGSPITGTDVIMNNLAGFMQFSDDHSGSALDIGVSSVGFVSQIAADAGATADKVSILTAGLAVDSTSANGNVTDAHLIRAFGLTFPGGVLNIDNIYGLKVENSISSLATNAYGISVEDASADNFLAKSLTIGGTAKQTTNNEIALEVDTVKSVRLGRATTLQRTALSNLSGLLIYDSNTNKYYGNDGSGWKEIQYALGAADIGKTPFTALDNQSVVTNITGLAFDNSTVRGFEAQITVVRASTYAEYSLKGIQKGASWEMSQDYIGDDTGIVFSIDSFGQIQYTSTSTGNTAALLFRANTV